MLHEVFNVKKCAARSLDKMQSWTVQKRWTVKPWLLKKKALAELVPWLSVSLLVIRSETEILKGHHDARQLSFATERYVGQEIN